MTRILVLPNTSLWEEIVTPEAEARLAAIGEVDRNLEAANLPRDEVLERIATADAVLTSWGAPVFDAELLARAPNLKVIAHAAGTIKPFVTPVAFEKGVAVTHAAAVIADSVGEWALTVTLGGLRRVVDFDRIMRAAGSGERPRGWGAEKRAAGYGEELFGKRVGVVAASLTGKAYVKLLRPFGCDVMIYDPYLSPEGAAALGGRVVPDLAELMSTSDIVSNHAPTTPETTGMISAEQLARLRDGALFVNTARAAAIDYAALTAELVSGRIRAALDVFPKEPLDDASPLRDLPNVLLSPHVAGATVESRRRLGTAMIDEIARFFAGQPMQYAVTAERLATMA
jgi:phosphoglycerate dehydrogenase-like enzyme